jgi:dihydroflavonol-4-reductase
LLGSNLIGLLIEQGHEVTALVRSRRKAAQVLGDQPVTLVEGDMGNVDAWASALAGCDTLFHTAAYFREYYAPGDHWATLKAINIDATLQLFTAAEAHGVAKTIYVSSSGVIGPNPGGGPSDETTPPGSGAMENLYFRSKVLGEQAIAQFLETHALDVVLILPGWIFGPGDGAPTTSGQIVLDLLDRKLPAIPPGGSAIVDVRDVAQAMVNAVTRGRRGERYIVSGRYASLADVARTVERVADVPAPKLRLPYSVALTYAWVAQTYALLTSTPTVVTVNGIRSMHDHIDLSWAKAERELGATFRPLENTLRDEVAWFRVQRATPAPPVPHTTGASA